MARKDDLVWGRWSRRLFLGMVFATLILLFAPIFFWAVEHEKSDDVHSIGDAYGWLFRTLFENTSPYKLKTQFGFIAYWLVRVAGVSLVAFATATVASRFVQTVINRGAGMGTFKGSEHLLICGWSPKGSEIIRELRAKEVEDPRPIVVLADRETAPVEGDGVTYIRGNPSNAEDLERAGLDDVSTVIVLADASNTSDDPDDLDARSLLTTLAVESLNPGAYTCVEVVKSENRQHFERTRADELVVSAELTGSLLAASARTHGLTAVVADLLTHPDGQEFYRVTVPPELTGATVRHALDVLKDDHDSMLVGVFLENTCTVNPPGTDVLTTANELLVVRNRPVGDPGPASDASPTAPAPLRAAARPVAAAAPAAPAVPEPRQAVPESPVRVPPVPAPPASDAGNRASPDTPDAATEAKAKGNGKGKKAKKKGKGRSEVERLLDADL